MRKLLVALVVLIASSFVTAGDRDKAPPPPTIVDLPEKAFREVPNEITISGKRLCFEPYLWRDFMPISPPDGQPMYACIKVKSLDKTAPPKILIEKAWVINQSKAWIVTLGSVDKQENGPGASLRQAGNGPKWGPGIEVDVVIEFRDEQGKIHRLRKEKLTVQRTD